MIRNLVIAALALALASTAAPRADRDPVVALDGRRPATTRLNELATKFNASQKDYKVVPVFKGSYPESMTAAIAAYRAGNAPHILQVFEVGTATDDGRQGRDRSGRPR